ncbi:protein trapped in endoderm-1-like [Penaeus japonicus]|uniref:protein trapped in endoderm-1-like n=1 Tax=Penaeus japonicus TaxID=27405 RepID=UPI001C711F63|nr:protein trapped in endoderm-1-like [Penaeus japonicus]
MESLGEDSTHTVASLLADTHNMSTRPGCDSGPSLPTAWSLQMAIVFGGAVSLIGGLGNLVAVVVLVQQTMTRRSQRILKVTADSVLVLQLAVVDLLYCTVSLPLCVVSYVRGKEMLEPLCDFAGFFRLFIANVEFNTLGLVALERSYHIYRGRRSAGGVFSVRRTRMYCVVLWVLGFAFQLPGISMDKYGFNFMTYKCDLLITAPAVRGLLVGLEVMLPLIVLLTSYFAIHRRVKKSKALLDGFSSKKCDSRSALLTRRHRSAGRSVLGLTILYCVCILPMAVHNIVDENGYYKEIGIVLNCLYWIQYAANTVIYAFTNNRFNKAIRILVRCRGGGGGGCRRQQTIDGGGGGTRHVAMALSSSFKKLPDGSSRC